MCFLSLICIRSVLSRQQNTQIPPSQWFLARRGLLSKKMSTWTFGGQNMDQDPRAGVAGAAKWFSCISIIFMDFHWLFLQLRKRPNSLSIAVNQKWKLSAFSDIRPKRVCFQQNTQFLALSLTHIHNSLHFRKSAELYGSIWSLNPLTSKYSKSFKHANIWKAYNMSQDAKWVPL